MVHQTGERRSRKSDARGPPFSCASLSLSLSPTSLRCCLLSFSPAIGLPTDSQPPYFLGLSILCRVFDSLRQSRATPAQ